MYIYIYIYTYTYKCMYIYALPESTEEEAEVGFVQGRLQRGDTV